MLIGVSSISLLIAACEPGLPQPSLYACSPDWVDNDDEHTITLIGDGFYPQIQVTLDDEVAVDRQFRAWLVSDTPNVPDVEIPVTALSGFETLSAAVPAGLAPGSYDVLLQTPTGRTDTLEAALDITDTAADHIALSTDAQVFPTHSTVRVYVSIQDTEHQPLGVDFPVTVSVSGGDGVLDFGQTLDGQVQLTERIVEGVLDGGSGYLELSTEQPGSYTLDFSAPDDVPFLANDDLSAQLTVWFVPGEIADISLELDQELATAGDEVAAHLALLDTSGNPTTYPLSQTFLVTERCSNEQGAFQDTVTFPADTEQISFTVQPHVITGTLGCQQGIFDVQLVDGDTRLSTSSAPITVLPGDPSSLQVETTYTTEMVAGEERAQLVVVAEDGYGNLLTDYQQPLSFRGSLEGAVESSCFSWQEGRTLCSVALLRAGEAAHVEVFSGDGLSGLSAPIRVLPGPPASMTLQSTPSTSRAGDPRAFLLELLDAYDNPADVPVGDGAPSLGWEGEPVACTLTSSEVGVAGYDCVLTTAAEGVVVTAQIGTIEASSQPFDVINGELVDVTISSPGDLEAGESFSAHLAGTDAYGNAFIESGSGSNIVELYDDSGELTEQVPLGSDGTAVLSSLSLTVAWDDNSLSAYQGGRWLGQSDVFDVHTAALDGFALSTPQAWIEVGEPLEVTVRAVDTYDNTIDDFSGTGGTLASAAGLGDDVVLTAFQDGRLETTFTFSAVGLSDRLSVELGDLTGESDAVDAVTSDCERPPTAALLVDGEAEAVLCLSEGATDVVTVSAAGSAAGLSSLDTWHFYTEPTGWVRQTSDALQSSWSWPGVSIADVVVIDTSGCYDVASAAVYVADDDGSPAGPIAISTPTSSMTADTTSSSGSATVSLSAMDCTGAAAAAAGTISVRADVGVLSSASSTVSDSGSGLVVTLDSFGEAEVSWRVGGQLHGGMDATAWFGRTDGAAAGSLTLPVTGDVSLPIVTAIDPVGSISSSFDVITLRFSEDIDPVTVSDSTVSLLDPDELPVSILDYDVDGDTVTVTLADEADPGEGEWSLLLDQGITDLDGNALSGNFSGSSADFSVSFGDVTDSAPDMDSCSADLSRFRPDGDDGSGSEADEIELAFDASGKAAWWMISVTDSDDETVSVIVSSANSSDKGSLIWGGRGSDGRVLSSGSYTLSIAALDDAWNTGSDCEVSVEIDHDLQ